MKKRVAFRSFVILLAAVMLLSSTSAYNILVYANQDSVANSLSAIGSISEDAVTEPTIAVQGGSLELEPNAEEESTEPSTVVWVGNGTEQNPYQIATAAHLMQVNKMVNATIVNAETGIHAVDQKHFILTADIDLTPLFANGAIPFIASAGSAYLVSTDSNDPTSSMKYINLDGSYDGGKHKIYLDESVSIDVKNYENFALFGFLGSNSVISNVIFENINVNVTALQPQRISVIAYRNDGIIRDCDVINSSVTFPAKSETDGSGKDGMYFGISGAVADNRATVSGVSVKNFTLTLSSSTSNDYIGGLVGQNRGTVEKSSISGLKMTVTGINHYVGGLVGYNAETVTGCAVDMAGNNNTENNMFGGGYVGGLVGYNDSDAVISNSSVTGSVTSAQSTTSTRYNMYGTAENANSSVAYFGGITGVNKGTIEKTTVSDLGFYMGFNSVSYVGCFGGIAAVSTGGVINTSVSSGSFVSQNNTVCRAGGIIGYAQANDTKIVNDCYALFRLSVPAVDLVGAIVGYGGNTQTAINSYWSDAISGCVTSYVVDGDKSDGIERPVVIESSIGKLNSINRAVTVAKNAPKTVNASELVHSFEKIFGASFDVARITVENNIELVGTGSNNSIFNQEYSARIVFPTALSGNPLIGSDDKQGMPISINLDVFVTSATGDPDSQTNPLVISSSSMAKFIVQAPYGHYKLSTDIAVLNSAWNVRYFTGSLDGNNHIISTDTNLFKGIIGSRKSAPEVNNAVTLPNRDSAENTQNGVIKNLNVDLSYNINTAIFGTVYNSTFINVALTDGDPTVDDGNDASYEGYIANISNDYTAAFINYAVGNCYIYGCSTDVSVRMGNVVNSAAFIAFIGKSVVIDNCVVNSVSAYIGEKNNTSKAVFIGYAKDNTTGLVLNSVVTARVVGSGTCYLVLGENLTEHSTTYKNITWSKMHYESNEIDSNMNSTEIKLWGSSGKKYSSIKQTEPLGTTTSVYKIAIPQNISAFANASISDFSISVISIDEENNYAENQLDGETFKLNNAYVENGEIVLNIGISPDATEGESAWVKVFHYDTGLLTYVKITLVKEVFECGEDGYYHISTPADLIEFSNVTNSDESKYLTYAYKLDNDIDMSGYIFTPAAMSGTFSGRFDGMGKTIKNLTIMVDTTAQNATSNVAFISSAVSGHKITINNKTSGQIITEKIDSGIYNVNFENANVSAIGESANVAVLLASSVSETETQYAQIDIANIEIFGDTKVVSQGKNTAAILAYSKNTNINISGIELSNVAVQTAYSESEDTIKYINDTSATAVGGLGGIIGTVHDTVAQPTESRSVNVTNITINGLNLTGVIENQEAYAMVNAGAVVGTYQKWYSRTGVAVPKLSIGNVDSEKAYDVEVNDLLIMSTGITGGIIGSTNAQTSVNKVKVSASEGNKTQILSTTKYFIGGIAGHIGSYDKDGETDTNAVANMFGQISHCLVESSEIKATNLAISSTSNKIDRNVCVGGIVGAISGPSIGKTIKDCTVRNSVVEGVVVGGIVGSNIERTVVVGNVIHINECDISATKIKTIDECYPVAFKLAASSPVNSAGVGGILGTNYYSTASYAANVLIDYCDIDDSTEIINSIYAKYGSNQTQSATGGIIGSGFQLKSNGVQLALKHNTVYADIKAENADMSVAACWNMPSTQINNKLRVGTGGFIGMLAGYGLTITDVTAVYLMTICVQDSVFGGSIIGTDCIGGVIGSVFNAIGYASTNATATNNRPTDFIKNIVVSGQLKSKLDSTKYYRGGIAIGSILINNYLPGTSGGAIGCFNKDMTQTFSGIYFSSLTIDTAEFPVFSCVGLVKTNAGTTMYVPTYNTTKGYLQSCYVDVNCKSDNKTVQISDKTASAPFTINGTSAPVATRGTMFTLEPVAELDNAQSYWQSNNPMIASVSDNSIYSSVKVTPKSANDNAVIISIDYLGVLTSTDDPSWIVPVKLPVGFRLKSTAEKVLDYVEYNGKTYYLISDKIDFNYIESGKNYWLKNDILFTPEDFQEPDGIFAGGYPSSSKENSPFSGEFASMPKEKFTVHTANGSETYDSTTEIKRISGLQLKAVTGGTYSAAALFAFAEDATFKNFIISDISYNESSDYAAAIAAVVKGSLTVDNVIVENANISGAKYSGGLFGGMFDGDTTISKPWNVTNSSLKGIRSISGDTVSYTTNIVGINGAAGIAVHTDKNAADFSNVLVSGSCISQVSTIVDAERFDNGAAGIVLAYSGTITEKLGRNIIENSCILGEIAAGAVVRTYTSANTNAFTSAGIDAQVYSSVPLNISGVDVKSTIVEGTHTTAASRYYNYMVSSGGILARVDSSYVDHIISDCTLDKNTTIKAPYGAGGILGCFEETDATTASVIDQKSFGIKVDNCDVEATVSISSGKTIKGTSTSYYYFNMGAGGIIGAFSALSNLTKTNISNCRVTGVISGPSAVGGIIGAIWTNYSGTAPSTFRLDNMDTHFIENCIVSAEFKNEAGEDSFVTSTPATGIIVGHVLSSSASSSDSIFRAAANNGFKSDFSNQPFYNIYYSGHKYPQNSTYLFGIANMSAATKTSLNYCADGNENVYSCYTDYIYDMDYMYTDKDGEVVSTEIDSTDDNLIFSDVYRVQQTQSEEDGIWVIDYRTLGSGMSINLSDFTFNTAPTIGAESDVTYRFDNGASLSEFTLSASKGSSQTSVATLEKVTATSSAINVEQGSADGEYIISAPNTLLKTLVFDLMFVYSNGLELVAPFRIEVSDGDYYFSANGDGGTNYYIFNAANLNSTMQLTLGEKDNVIQCFDVFWTLDNAEIKNAVNTYTNDVTLNQAYAGITFDSKDFVTLLESVQHPNPEYDKELGNAENLSIKDYLGLTTDEPLGEVSLRRLVKEINLISYGTYGDEGESTLYEKDFAGKYTVLKSVTTDKSTGLTNANEFYSIYGLELHSVNVNAQKADATHTGLFKSLASGAEVTGLTFVNPRIEVVGAKAEENYAGVLAGTATGAKIKDVTVERYDADDKAYVSSIRWMTAASTNVGGIVGKADSATTIENAKVRGIDIVGASLAGSNAKQLKTVMAGGIAGASDATITNASVTDSRILIERNDRYRNYYLSYAGGIAARATGTVSGATVNNTVMRDCTCEVIVNDEDHSDPYSTYSCEDTALVADRIGGITAFTNGSLNISGAEVTGISIAAFDIAGGILAEVENNNDAVVAITNSSVADESDIRVYSSANVASVSSLRQYFNAAGGAIGKLDNLKSLNIDTFNFEGYVGTYSYDNLNKDCTAGGIIGFVTEKLGTLDAIKIYNSTVSGEVSGYRTTKTGNMVPYLGAAGGIIGKINTTKGKSATDTMVSHCVMGAEVNLYNNVNGTAINAIVADPANSESTNVGKVLGTLVKATIDSETQKVISSNFALDIAKEGEISKYFDRIYVSSYPQDIVAYGSKDLYVSQYFSPFTTYTDINKVVVNTATGETTGALAIGGLDLTGNDTPEYTNDEYSELAIIPIDSKNNVAGEATRGFRVKHNSITFGNGNEIVFEGTANIVAEADIKDATIDIKTGSDLANKNDGYYYGTLHIGNVETDIIGDIVMDYSYGLQINVQFIGMDIEGDGSSTNPFQVKEPKHFAVVRVLRDKHYKQIADIDFVSQYSYSEEVMSPLWATLEGFEPIGTEKAPFVGSYDGQGHLLENLYISRANTDDVGLFGYVKGTAENPASISNVHIEIADKMSLSLNKDNLGEVTPVQGNVTGNNNVGGLVGSAVNAIITNCSVVKGNVIGSSAVGGLVGEATASNFASCFTSTTAFAHADLNYESSSAKTAGGLVGTVSGSSTLSNCFTLGYAGLDPNSSGLNYGAVGSFVGYVDSGALLEINNAFVGAGVSDSYGYRSNNVTYRGITVGATGENANVNASNVFISATVAEGEYASAGVVTEKLNPILGTSSGATIVENVSFDSGLNGTLPNRVGIKEDKSNNVDATQEQLAKPAAFGVDVVICAETPEANKAENKSYIEIGVNADTDPYTAAYVEFAGVQIKVSDVETTDRMATSQASATESTKYQLGGLFYPLTVADKDVTVKSSLIDTSDVDGYYEEIHGMDAQLYGNGDVTDYADKNTDFLFKDTENGTTVYTNIFVFKPLTGMYQDGKPYENGELFYSNSLPYFTIEKTVGDYSLFRKVTYPIQLRLEDNGRLYPIATERQLNALSSYESQFNKENTFTTFELDKNYALIENITLGDYNFKPISGFKGVFNGKGYTVSNITINQSGSTSPVGFFSELNIGSVKNLKLEVNTVVGNDYVGGLVGYIGSNNNAPSATIINNCSVSAYNDKGDVKGNDYVGGLVGYAVAGDTAGKNPLTKLEEGKAGIFNSYTDVKVSGINVVGGLVGGSEMYITNCYSIGDVNGTINSVGDTPRGIGGLVGLLAAKSIVDAYPQETERSNYQALLNSSFSSSAVKVDSVNGYNNRGNGVGGLVGNVTQDTSIATVFSSGSVRFCYDDNVAHPDCVNSPAIGIGGLVGVLNSETKEVYSAASVAAKVGNLTTDSVVGIGGVVGVSNAVLQSAYSSGSTLGETSTTAQEMADNDYNYGVGGVIGLVSGKGLESSNLYFDHNASAVSDDSIGKVTKGELTTPESIGSKSTKEFTQLPESERVDGGFLGGNFKFTTGAYPYLSNFFDDTVSLVIRFNALLSIVAIEIDERDKSAIDGEGISMAMNIPTGVPHDGVVYTYGFEADKNAGMSATCIVDTDTNTLSIQRTSNTKEQANFIVTISTVNGKASDGNIVYSEIASRPFSRVTAEMLGTKDKPYLVASQSDLEHVAMSEKELRDATGLYTQWDNQIDSNGTEIAGKVHYRLMGYVYLNQKNEDGTIDSYTRESFSKLPGGYSFDGNGYSIHNLDKTLVNELDTKSEIKNITFENVAFESDESLIGTLNGSVVGVNVYGTATGSKVAGIAATVGESTVDENGNVISGLVKGCISKLDYSGTNGANFAGLVLENNGTIEMSASVGSISGKNLTNVNALVGTNNGTIKNSFTMGDIILDNPAGVVSGFVGTNTGKVEACYTRCNFKVSNADTSVDQTSNVPKLVIGSFAGKNTSLSSEKIASIVSSFAAGLFEVRQPEKDIENPETQAIEKIAYPVKLDSIFVAQNSGELKDVMFDKQLSGTCFKDIFTYAESTSDIATLANHKALAGENGAYLLATKVVGESTVLKADEYPQLSVILATADSNDEVTVRMYRTLRSYSLLSTATAFVANDNYIDNVPLKTKVGETEDYTVTPLTAGKMSWSISGNAETSGTALKTKAVGDAVATASLAIEDFYNVGASAKLSDTLNLYFVIDDDGANPNFAGGDGSTDSKYQISAPEHVIALSYYGKNSSSYFEVTKDIDMSGANWNDSYINIFKANLDGKGYAFSNVAIPENGSNAFIGSLEGGSISNLGLTGIKVTTATTGASGLLAAKALNNASVTNCVVFGELDAPTGSNVGGLFGETDGQTVIDGCIVSGKIDSGATYVGGLVGNAADGTTVTNCLSTALVNGGENTTATGGIIGSGTATVTNCIVAGNVKGGAAGNVAGESESVTVTNSYYDKQLSTVDGGANASTTHYLTAGADVADFGGNMVWITGFVGYPVPVYFASASGAMLNAVKLASAKITFANGVGAGTSTTFTTATPTAIENAELGVSVSESGKNFLVADKDNMLWKTQTNQMSLSEVYGGELTYTLGQMTRYVDVTVGKKVTAVSYKITGLSSGNSIVSAITGNGGAATAATAFDTAQQGVLCNDMVFTYDVVDGKVQLFRVETQLPDGYEQGEVTVVFNTATPTTVTAQTDENGIAYIAVPTSIGIFDTVSITVAANATDTWGVRNLFGLFR